MYIIREGQSYKLSKDGEVSDIPSKYYTRLNKIGLKNNTQTPIELRNKRYYLIKDSKRYPIARVIVEGKADSKTRRGHKVQTGPTPLSQYNPIKVRREPGETRGNELIIKLERPKDKSKSKQQTDDELIAKAVDPKYPAYPVGQVGEIALQNALNRKQYLSAELERASRGLSARLNPGVSTAPVTKSAEPMISEAAVNRLLSSLYPKAQRERHKESIRQHFIEEEGREPTSDELDQMYGDERGPVAAGAQEIARREERGEWNEFAPASELPSSAYEGIGDDEYQRILSKYSITGSKTEWPRSKADASSGPTTENALEAYLDEDDS